MSRACEACGHSLAMHDLLGCWESADGETFCACAFLPTRKEADEDRRGHRTVHHG